MAECNMEQQQEKKKKRPTISGSGTSSWVPEGATTARRVSPLKALQMSSCVTNLYVQGGLRESHTTVDEKRPGKTRPD